MTYEEFLRTDKILDKRLEYISMELNFYPKDKNGIVKKEYRNNPNYKMLEAEYSAVKKVLDKHRSKNKKFNKRKQIDNMPSWRISKQQNN